MNEIALGVLRILRGELEAHAITAHAELTPKLPLVMGHKGQLQEVILNLVHNAVEAMVFGRCQPRGFSEVVLTQFHFPLLG